MTARVGEVEELKKTISEMKEQLEVHEKETMINFETELMKYKTDMNRKIDEIKLDINSGAEEVSKIKHSIEMINLETNRIDREV